MVSLRELEILNVLLWQYAVLWSQNIAPVYTKLRPAWISMFWVIQAALARSSAVNRMKLPT